ncbi:hypothetical protein L6452_09667 [Arctium lappa]|uniref:Uncharacterized protein n=1 Tax=Arctium lappa TaxID=4217 RepID=A0ACB9DL84_ARCLA|nr:hypothetical protein L6452_09667 [Arctium lappa]
MEDQTTYLLDWSYFFHGKVDDTLSDGTLARELLYLAVLQQVYRGCSYSVSATILSNSFTVIIDALACECVIAYYILLWFSAIINLARMAQSTSGSDRCSDNLDGSQHALTCDQGDLVPFPGFIVNNKNDVEDYTPITKIPCGSVLNCVNSAKSTEESSSTATTKTPPIEPSVSPEIQSSLCRSVLVSGAAPSTCYGAGHVISGVTDKRKCKARGILTVGCRNPLERDIPEDIFRKSRPSMIPFPAEASISWHLSPSYVNDDGDAGKANYPKGLHQSSKMVESAIIPSHSSPSGSPSCTLNPKFQGLLEPISNKVVNKSSPTSPRDPPSRGTVISQEERTLSFNFNSECSPFSACSLSSGNVMQTPNSDSSLERHGSLSWLKEGTQLNHQFKSELDQVTDVFQHESLSLEDDTSPWDPPSLSLELADLPSPSDLTNLNHLRENSDSHASWVSNSTLGNVSESQMRISWRDGLISGTFDKDDLDCCRLLSDEEMDADELLKSHRFPEHKVRADGNDKETSFHIQLNPCAESIGTDDGGLIASGDSDWTLYYKKPVV